MNGDDAVELTVATLGRRAAAALLDLFVPLTCWALATWIIVASDPRPLAMPPWNLFDTVIDYLHDRPGRAAASVFVLVVAQVGWPLLFRVLRNRELR